MEVSSSVVPSMSTSAGMIKKTNLPFSIHNYCFTEVIGHGGFSEVYLGKNILYGNEFVAKVMTVDASEMKESWEIFDAEVTSLKLLDHPHVIRLYDHFHQGNQFYMILEFCKGGSLHEEIMRCNGLSFPRFQEVGREVVEALAYCHDRGIAHRDIKPGNILLDQSGHVRIADFGLSLQAKEGQLYYSYGGSFEYTAPEIFEKRPHNPMKGDVWALGVVFAIMATGGSPWIYESLGELKCLAIQAQLQFKKPIPDLISDLIHKLVVVDPAKRLDMKDILNHPVFIQPRVRKNKFVSRSLHIGLEIKPQWNNITRVSGENIDDDFNTLFPEDPEYLQEDRINLQKITAIHSASSVFMHAIKKKPQVKQRVIRKAPSVFETFPIDDVQEI